MTVDRSFLIDRIPPHRPFLLLHPQVRSVHRIAPVLDMLDKVVAVKERDHLAVPQLRKGLILALVLVGIRFLAVKVVKRSSCCHILDLMVLVRVVGHRMFRVRMGVPVVACHMRCLDDLV